MTGWSLELAVVCAVVAAVVAVLPLARLRGLTTGFLAAAVVALWASVLRLGIALVAEDTAWRSVIEQTRPGTSWVRRVSGLWSGAEGSLLLYASTVALVAMVGHRSAPRWQQSGVALTIAGLAAASAWGADPFQRVPLPPAGGVGMAPILEHGAMFVHPPMLYAGMALALAPALVRDSRVANRFVGASLAATAGALALGASWAYVELGWGGWWAWDPIENVGLVVWLLLAAALHADRADDQRRTIALQALCWPAVLGGAALTRTSLRTSVHAFADAAELAAWLWPLVVIAAVGALVRAREGAVAVGADGPVGRRRTAVTAAGLLFVAAFVIALGTWRPFVGGDGTQGWFYTRALFPLVLVGTAALGLAPGRDRSTTSSYSQLRVGFVGFGAATGVAIAAFVGASSWYQLAFAGSLGIGAAALATASTTRAQVLAHIGVWLVLVASLAATAGTDADLSLAVGERADVAGHTVQLDRIDVIDGPPSLVAAAVVIDGGPELRPSVTHYVDRNLRLPEIATRSRPWRDVQVILRDVRIAERDDATPIARLTIRVRPLTQLVWWGAGLVAAGSLLARSGARRRGERSLPVAFGPK